LTKGPEKVDDRRRKSAGEKKDKSARDIFRALLLVLDFFPFFLYSWANEGPKRSRTKGVKVNETKAKVLKYDKKIKVHKQTHAKH